MELQRHLPDFEAAGTDLFAITYDPPETLAAFAADHGITFHLLSDADSAVIRAFGILNTLVRPDEPVYGIPFPGSYVVDERGVVIEKRFHRRYQVRDSSPSMLYEALGVGLDPTRQPSAVEETPGVRISAVLGSEELAFQRRALILVRMELDEGLHVYGEPVPDGYFGTHVEVRGPEGLIVEPPRYPPTRPLRIDALGEEFHVFEGTVEIAVPIVSAIRDVDRVSLAVEIRYQACDDRQCFIPQRRVLEIEVPLAPLNRPASRA